MNAFPETFLLTCCDQRLSNQDHSFSPWSCQLQCSPTSNFLTSRRPWCPQPPSSHWAIHPQWAQAQGWRPSWTSDSTLDRSQSLSDELTSWNRSSRLLQPRWGQFPQTASVKVKMFQHGFSLLTLWQYTCSLGLGIFLLSWQELFSVRVLNLTVASGMSLLPIFHVTLTLDFSKA